MTINYFHSKFKAVEQFENQNSTLYEEVDEGEVNEIESFNFESEVEDCKELDETLHETIDPLDDNDCFQNRKYIDTLKRYFGHSKFRP